jgi:hypothetical protein
MSNADRNQVRRIVLTAEFVLDLFDPRTRVVNGVPDDTKFIKMWHEPSKDTFEIMIQSETFTPVDKGEQVPEYDLVFENVDRFGTQSGLH